MFDAIVISGEVGMRKPEPGIFAHALELLAVEAGQTVFVDDLRVNVTAAAELGFVGVHHVTYDQTAGELEALFGCAPCARESRLTIVRQIAISVHRFAVDSQSVHGRRDLGDRMHHVTYGRTAVRTGRNDEESLLVRNPLVDMVQRQKHGEPVGLTSVCSAHPLVIEAAVLQARDDGRGGARRGDVEPG